LRRPGLTLRLVLVAGLALTITIAALATLALGVQGLRAQSERYRQAEAVVDAANQAQKSILDLETGARAFMITHNERFLEPWAAARRTLDGDLRRLRARVAQETNDGPQERVLAAHIGGLARSYLVDHSLPLVHDVRRGRLDADRLVAETREGKGRVDALRALFKRLIVHQRREAALAARRADDASSRALLAGLAALILVIGVATGAIWYLARTVTGPVARVAQAARELSGGWLDERDALVARLPAGAAPEIASLTESFDSLAQAVREGRSRLERQNTSLERRIQERTRDLEDARYEALLMLAVAAEVRDDDTYRHTRRVGRNAGLIAEKMGLSEEAVGLIREAAPLHDVGKIGVSDTILMKPGKLTDEEFEAMKQHVAIGASILASSTAPLFHVAAQIAETHHERWDGTGYLNRLAGEDIPLAGRIVAVVDVFDALSHDRVYKEAWSVERAAEEIRRCAGTHFDPAIVTAFEALDPHVLAADVDPDPVEAIAS
jgi:CHASE3 domain sensor protein